MKYLIASFALFLFQSCGIDDATNLTKSQILASKTWQIQEVTASGYLNGQVYLRGRTAEGSQYDMSKVRLTFKSDGTCFAIDNTGNNSSSGKWKLNDAKTQLTISETNYFVLDGIGSIVNLSSSNFTFSGSRTYRASSIESTVKMVPVP